MVGTRRLVALATALGLAATGSLLALSPVEADTGDITYTCTIPDFPAQNIDISLSTNAPATMVVGETFSPTLKLTVVIPALITFLAQGTGYTHASAAGTLGVGINGTPTTLAATYPKTPIPIGQDFEVDINIPLPELKPTQVGNFTYTPGPLNAQLSIYQGADDETADSIDAACAVQNPSSNPVIDTVVVTDGTTLPPAKAATTTSASAPTVTYGKAGKVTVVVANAGGVPVTGSVSLVGAGTLAPQQVVNGRGTFTLPKTLAVRTHSLKATYSGSSTLLGSTKSFSFRVAKASAAGIALSLKKKPTSSKTGKATVSVKAPSGLPTPTGKVTLVLKKGSKVKTVTVTLSGGKKSAVLPKLAKGTWTVKVKYSGSSVYNAVTSKPFAFTVTK